MIVVAVIGSKKSGKTTTIEALVRGLVRREYYVATLKHIRERDFTIDTEGKDTWRHAQAGAKKTVVVAPRELVIIKKTDTANLSLEEIIENCRNNTEIAILEGFRSLVEHEPRVPKIVAVKTLDEALQASRHVKPIIAFTAHPVMKEELDIQVVDVLKEPEKLVDIVLSGQPW